MVELYRNHINGKSGGYHFQPFTHNPRTIYTRHKGLYDGIPAHLAGLLSPMHLTPLHRPPVSHTYMPLWLFYTFLWLFCFPGLESLPCSSGFHYCKYYKLQLGKSLESHSWILPADAEATSMLFIQFVYTASKVIIRTCYVSVWFFIRH